MQFHPEHMAGPTDLVGLFDVFLDTVKDHKEGIAGKSGNTIFIIFNIVEHINLLPFKCISQYIHVTVAVSYKRNLCKPGLCNNYLYVMFIFSQ